MVAELERTAELVERVMAQTRVRLGGGVPDGSTRVVSLHDADARPIAKGRLGVDRRASSLRSSFRLAGRTTCKTHPLGTKPVRDGMGLAGGPVSEAAREGNAVRTHHAVADAERLSKPLLGEEPGSDSLRRLRRAAQQRLKRQ